MVEHVTDEPGGAAFRHGGRILRIVTLALVGIVTAVLFAALFGWLVKILWNWLMPALFGLKTISYWQGFGILLLAKMLFGGVGPGFGRHHGRWGRRFRGYSHRADLEEESDLEECSMPFDRRRWPLFRRFWREEGRAAFEDYVQKKKSEDEK